MVKPLDSVQLVQIILPPPPQFEIVSNLPFDSYYACIWREGDLNSILSEFRALAGIPLVLNLDRLPTGYIYQVLGKRGDQWVAEKKGPAGDLLRLYQIHLQPRASPLTVNPQ